MAKSILKGVLVVLAVCLAVGVSFYFLNHRTTTTERSREELLIENKGLPEFNSENDVVRTIVSPADTKISDKLLSIFKLMGDGKDSEKNRQAVSALSDLIEEYPEYSTAYYMRAGLSLLSSDRRTYQKSLDDVDKALSLSTVTKYKDIQGETSLGEGYVLRSRIEMLSLDYEQAIKDLETAIVADPSNTKTLLNNGTVRPEDEASTSAIQKTDLDLLVNKYPTDYRTFMFRGLFYYCFTNYDENYFPPALSDLKHAQILNPNSAMVAYFLGSVYQGSATWTKAAWADISESGGYRDKTNTIALQYFDEAIKLDPQFTEAWAEVAQSFYGLKQYKAAIPYYDRVLELDPKRGGAYNDRGLAKLFSDNYYAAIEDFSKAIDIKPKGTLFTTVLDTTYENRGDAYMKVSNFEAATADYGKVVGIKYAQQVFLMPVSQIRAVYPEFSNISDQDLLEGLRQKYFPNMKPTDFMEQHKKNLKPFEDFVLAGIYEKRGTSYLNVGNFRKAATEYIRALRVDRTYSLDRWKPISKDANSETDIDVQTLDFSQGSVVSLWIKSPNARSGTSTQTNFAIDCASRKIKSLASIAYDASGNPTGSTGEGNWQVVVPETIGEVLQNDACVKSSNPQ